MYVPVDKEPQIYIKVLQKLLAYYLSENFDVNNLNSSEL